MKEKSLQIIIAILFCILALQSKAQEAEDVGAGVIDFLLSNPKTANKMNSTEAAALNVLGDFLKTKSSREHEINVAEAGRSQVILNNSETGKQVLLVENQKGNAYVLYNGVIYPLSMEIVNQAKDSNTNNIPATITLKTTMPQYDIELLKAKFLKKKISTQFDEESTTKTVSMDHGSQPRPGVISMDCEEHYGYSNIEKAFQKLFGEEWGIYDIFIPGVSYKRLIKLTQQVKANEIPFPALTQIYFKKHSQISALKCTFTYNWYNDNDDNGIDVDDFHGIKRSFTRDEIISFAIVYYLQDASEYNLIVEIRNNENGNILLTKTLYVNGPGELVSNWELPDSDKLYGEYFYTVKLKKSDSDKIIDSVSEKFEILKE